MSGTDTLRAAVERLCDLADEGSPAERQHSPRWHVATVDLRAALAASPAPTDADRVVGDWLADFPGNVTVDEVRNVLRLGGSKPLRPPPAPTDTPDEREWCNDVIGPVERPTWFCTLPAGHIGNHEQRDDEDELEWSWRPRPAAVTAPREDEQGVFADPTPEDVEAAYASWGVAAAPAVERATPDPDTLAALLNEALDGICMPLGRITGPLVANRLIAAGVTYTPPTPEQGHTAP